MSNRRSYHEPQTLDESQEMEDSLGDLGKRSKSKRKMDSDSKNGSTNSDIKASRRKIRS